MTSPMTRTECLHVFLPAGPRIDAEHVQSFKERLLGAGLTEGGRFMLDLSRVGFVDSSGLGAVVWALKQARHFGGVVELCGLSGAVAQLFQLTRMDRVFRIHDTLESSDGTAVVA